MGDFFHGWRRKIGVVTLLAACVLAAGWIRSFSREDEIAITLLHRRQSFDSLSGMIHSWSWRGEAQSWPYEWHSREVIVERPPKLPVDSLITGMRCPLIVEERLMLAKIVASAFDDSQSDHVDSISHSLRKRTIPYWMIVLPLTMFSAYLLLIKPRKSVAKKPNEPPSGEEA
jgi:hypothetical protein